jgi:uncharacterized protein YcgI (DUF1989 family)
VTVIATVPVPATTGKAVRLAAGQQIRVIDPEGGQVADLFAYVERDIAEHLSAMHTRAVCSRLFPAVGEAFSSNHRRALLTFVADDSPGVHDMLIAPCDAERYQLLGVNRWHASCRENARDAMAELGFADVDVPQSVNLFMAIPVGHDGQLGWEPAPTQAGDSVTLRAELDLVVAVSACPQDIVPINHGRPGPIVIEILDAQ